MKTTPTDYIRDRLLEQALPEIAFDGWTWEVAERAALAAGFEKTMASAVFPGGLPDFVGHFSDWADRRMLDSLAGVENSDLRVRDRIRLGVITRIDILAPWREAVRRALTYWSVPHRSFISAKNIWRSADRMWIWAGDTATDYNHYTKRALLSGVISATTLAWLSDDSGDAAGIEAFLDRRLDTIMTLGKTIGKFRKSA